RKNACQHTTLSRFFRSEGGMHTPLRLEALELLLDTITRMRTLVESIESVDRDLARQIRRAASSAALNLAEADGSDRGNRRARLHTALGSLREARVGLRVAVAWGYVDDVAEAERALDRVAAMTWGLLRR
ncbi:MAG: four helix bundle protein, partial [Myxococcales bacterium]|nr:four helix bundle protein [Myxococcales bacterium]